MRTDDEPDSDRMLAAELQDLHSQDAVRALDVLRVRRQPDGGLRRLDHPGVEDYPGTLVEALLVWKQCPNLDEEERDYIEAWVERANMDFAAADKAKPDDKAQHQMAHNCRRATDSVKAATERCGNGKRPIE